MQSVAVLNVPPRETPSDAVRAAIAGGKIHWIVPFMNPRTKEVLEAIKLRPGMYMGRDRMLLDRLQAYFRGFHGGCNQVNENAMKMANALSKDYAMLERALGEHFDGDWFEILLAKHAGDQKAAFDEVIEFALRQE